MGESALSDLERCSISQWYPRLRRLSIRSILLPLPPRFLSHLLADGISHTEPQSSDDDSPGVPLFPELERAIGEAIEELGGAVFPKLNWSAPTDASWLLGGSIKCVSAGDVLSLLQSSDRVAHDVCEARAAPHSLVWDAYVESQSHKVYLIDVAPFHESVDPILFDWPTLRMLASRIPSNPSRDTPLLAKRSATDTDTKPTTTSIETKLSATGNESSTFLAAVAIRAADTRQGLYADHHGVVGSSVEVELRLVEEQGLAPTAQMYYGLPYDLREGSAQDVAALIANARAAAAEQSKEEEPTGSESDSHPQAAE
ncbi:MAG: hypothetical protein SGPRY_010458 [Prymnesium sp.]